MTANWIVVGLVVFFGTLFARAASHRGGAIRHKLRILLRAEAAFFLVTFAGAKLLDQQRQDPLIAVLAGFFVAVLIIVRAPRRSRYIPAGVRRETIARFEKKTKTKFDPAIHEIDHIVPFSKGGDHSNSNLRVVTRGENRAKSDKSPWWDILGS